MVVCGGGAWGYALVTFVGRRTLNDRKFHNSSLSLYDPSEELMATLADTRERPEFEGTRLPKNVFPTSDSMEAFRKANDIIVAVPPSEAGPLFKTIFSLAGDLRSIILASRGFDPLSHRLTIQIAWEAAASAGKPDVRVLALSGPFLPEDLVGDKGGNFILAGEAADGKMEEASLFKFGKFKVSLSHDPLGVQVAAALADAYALYGAHLDVHREIREPEAIAKFATEVSREAKLLAIALGATPSVFDSDSPAWLTEFICDFLSADRHHTVRIAVQKGPEALRAYLANKDRKEDWPDRGLTGYHSIKSAHLLAKHLGLRLKHMERAHKIFWGT
jgi:glycerol-3-phosphate dehydrogenase